MDNNKRAYKFFFLLLSNLTLCSSGSLEGYSGYSYKGLAKVSITSATDLKTNPSTAPFTTPITNPVTTYPVPPAGSIPVTLPISTPYTTPSANPVTSNPPTGLGDTWCVARTGLVESALQRALDYACGIPGAECSAIQQMGTCYKPDSLQHHASYAFNSYYHKDPSPFNCDFGGTAMIVNRDPSTDSCIYPSSSSVAATTPSSSSSSSSVLNTGNSTTTAASISGFRPPPYSSSSMSTSASLKPLVPTIVLLTSLFTRKLTTYI